MNRIDMAVLTVGVGMVVAFALLWAPQMIALSWLCGLTLYLHKRSTARSATHPRVSHRI